VTNCNVTAAAGFSSHAFESGGTEKENGVMKYIEATKFGGPELLRLVETETPKPGEGMLLVEVQAAGINYSDVMARSGFYPAITKTPFALGFEVAGTVKQVGKGVNSIKVGDSVAAMTLAGGGYASHIVIPAATAIPFPSQLDPALAVAVLVQGLTAYILLDQAQVKQDDVVLIAAAAGGVGSLAVQLAKIRGATVIGLASASKASLVKGLGADHVFDYDKVGWSKEASNVIPSRGIQMFLDSIGDLASEAFSLLSQFGQWIIYGIRTSHPNSLPVEALGPIIEKNISIIGFNLEGSLHHVPRALAELFKFLNEGKLKIEITKYPLADASKVHALFGERKTTGKLVLVP
jgi:NADPH2:quinone reductase